MSDIERITELVGNKEYDEAKPLIEKSLEENPNDIEILKLAGLAEVNLNCWNNAKKYFETIVKLEPEDATSWFYLANCYNNLGDFISSKNAYKKVIELRPEYPEAHKSLCVVLLKLNDIEETIKYANLGGELDREDYIYDFIIGTAYLKNKDFEKALQPLISAIQKSPNIVGTINSLGTCYMALGKTDEAIETYERAIELSPDNAMSYYNIGAGYQIKQEHERACEYFKKAIELEEDEAFLSSLAMSEVKLERFEDALKHYKQLALMCPSKENYKYNIVTCYEALGEYQIAIKMLEEIVYINPKYILPAQKLANLYIRTNELTKAKEIYDNILLKHSATADTLHQYAILTSTLCDTDTAEKMLKKVIKMNPDMAKAHKDLGIIYLNKRLFDYADTEFKLAMEIDPTDFEIIFEYGNFLYSTSRNKEAEEYYKKALDMNPKNVLTLTFMGLNKLVLNELDDAKNYILEAVKLQPNHEYVLFCTGRILYARGEYEDAKTYLIKAVELNPDIETQNTLALTYFALGEYQTALNIFNNIQAKSPNSVSVLIHIAKCQENLGVVDDALKTLDKLVEIFPDYEDAHEMIRKLS